MKVLEIHEMEHLSKRIGSDGMNRLNYMHNPEPVKGKNVMNVRNTVLMDMQGRRAGDPFCPADDIIKGVVRLDHYSTTRADKNIPLSTKRMYAILQTMEVINTREVICLLGCGERQARRYVKACKIVMPFLEDAIGGKDVEIDIDEYLGY